MAKEKKITRVSSMSADTAMAFFAIVAFTTDHGTEDTTELRDYILGWMGDKGMMDTVYETKRTPEQVVEDFKKRGFKIDDQREKDK